MTTPMQLAEGLARSPERASRVLGVAILTRGLTDDTPERSGWTLNEGAVRRASNHLRAGLSEAEIAEALALAPTLSDAILNRGAA